MRDRVRHLFGIDGLHARCYLHHDQSKQHRFGHHGLSQPWSYRANATDELGAVESSLQAFLNSQVYDQGATGMMQFLFLLGLREDVPHLDDAKDLVRTWRHKDLALEHIAQGNLLVEEVALQVRFEETQEVHNKVMDSHTLVEHSSQSKAQKDICDEGQCLILGQTSCGHMRRSQRVIVSSHHFQRQNEHGFLDSLVAQRRWRVLLERHPPQQ